MGAKTDVLTILRAATYESERGDHDFCLSRSHYTDTDLTSRERVAAVNDCIDNVTNCNNRVQAKNCSYFFLFIFPLILFLFSFLFLSSSHFSYSSSFSFSSV